MARLSNDEKNELIHQEALASFDEIQAVMRPERIQCLQDRRFASIAGAQWEGKLGEQFENKPKFEVNKVHLAVIRRINEYRNNRITADFISKDGSENDKLADVCDGLYRADEQYSNADEAYDNAFEEAVTGGFGAYRYIAKYEDDEDPDDERQRICIEPIFDADSSVFFDLNAKRQDKADAQFCFVITSMTHGAYRDEYDDDPSSWPAAVKDTFFDWNTPDVVYVAEYYKIEKKKETVYVYRDVLGNEERYTDEDFKGDPELEASLEAMGSQLLRTKKCKVPKVRKYIMSGGGILEDCGYIAGKHIPIVPVYGKRWFVDNVERCMGVVRLAKDPQRLKNMQLSKLGEISALSSIEKPIFTPEQMSGHQVMWAQDNLKAYPYLLVNSITDANGQKMPAGPIAYTKSAQIPSAMAALLQITETDMQEILGSQQQGDKMVSNISGKAVDMIQQRLDMQDFIYMSNFAKGVKRGGEIWLSMAQELYTEAGRKMKIISANGDAESVELLRPEMDKASGMSGIANDLSKAKFEVAVDVGPSSSSKRAATVRALTGMMAISTDGETKQVLESMTMMNMEGEGVEDVRNFFRRRLVKMGVVEPTEKEREEMEAEAAAAANAPPDPNAQLLLSMAQEAEAKAAKARADTVKTAADSELSRAKTVETLAKIDMDAQDHALNMAKEIGVAIQQQTSAIPMPDTIYPQEPPAQAL